MTITSHRDEIAAALNSASPAAQLEAIARIAANPAAPLAEAVRDAILRCLGAESKSVRRRAAEAAARAAQHDRRLIARLHALIDNGTPRERFCAAYALSLCGGGALDLRAAAALFEALGDADGDVRWAAHDLLMRLGAEYPPQIRAGLLAIAESGAPDARKMALYCLRDLAPDGPDVLRAALSAGGAANTHVRLASLAILARLPAFRADASEAAARMLERDPVPGVRRAAAAALGLIGEGSPGVLESLGRAARDELDSALSRAARAALIRIAQGQAGRK